MAGYSGTVLPKDRQVRVLLNSQTANPGTPGKRGEVKDMKIYEGKEYLVFPFAPLNETTVIYTASRLGKTILGLMLYLVATIPWVTNPWCLSPLEEPTNSVYLGCRSSARRIRKLWSSLLNGIGLQPGECRLNYHVFQSRRANKAVDEADLVIVDGFSTVRMDFSVFKNKTVLIFTDPSFLRSSLFRGVDSWELFETPAEVEYWPWWMERQPAEKALNLVLVSGKQEGISPFGYRVELRHESIEVCGRNLMGGEVCRLTGKRGGYTP